METPGLSTTRIAAFSDSVFAFAATLLALNIKVPDVLPTELTTELRRQVLHLWPQVLSYMMSLSRLLDQGSNLNSAVFR